MFVQFQLQVARLRILFYIYILIIQSKQMKSPCTHTSTVNYTGIIKISDFWRPKTTYKPYKYADIEQNHNISQNFTTSNVFGPDVLVKPAPALRFTIGSPLGLDIQNNKKKLQLFQRGSSHNAKNTSGQNLLSNKVNEKSQILLGNSKIKINNSNVIDTIKIKKTNKHLKNQENNYNKTIQKINKNQQIINELKKLSQSKFGQKNSTIYVYSKLQKKQQKTTINSFKSQTSTVGSSNPSYVKLNLSIPNIYQSNSYDTNSCLSNVQKVSNDFKHNNPEQKKYGQNFKINKLNNSNKGDNNIISQYKQSLKLKTVNEIYQQNSIQLDNNSNSYSNLMKDTYCTTLNIKQNDKMRVKGIKDVRKELETKCNKIGSTSLVSKKPSIHDFHLTKSLGQGKFGTVFQAIHKQTKFLCALKKISKNMIKQYQMIDQFLLQIKIQSYCNHQKILKLYGFFHDCDHIYLILQYMQEGTLFTQLKKNKALTEIEAGKKLYHVAEAIHYLHKEKIVHRDIKPENIVMSYGIGKLCDFGWAAICNQRRKTYCGTLDYSAPQILQGSQYDMSVDLWCLGVLAYELMVGKAPFYHISRKQTMKKILNVEQTAIQFPAFLSKNVVSFIDSLIRKNSKERMTGEYILQHPFLINFKEKEL